MKPDRTELTGFITVVLVIVALVIFALIREYSVPKVSDNPTLHMVLPKQVPEFAIISENRTTVYNAFTCVIVNVIE